jgi:hypothetical protein
MTGDIGAAAATWSRRLLAAAIASAACFAQAQVTKCGNIQSLNVPGAPMQVSACLDDLSTKYLVATGHTDASDWLPLHSAATRNPSGAVPGIQIDGYFPDTSTMNAYKGWNHDAQFVIRLPDHWNGKLIVTGAPGVRRQYATDYLISDWVLAQGYAFAATDKGNSGTNFHRDGATPGDAIAEWHQRVTELTLAAKDVVRQRYGQAPAYTYITGISNGGYLTRHALENRPDLYDGGVDWEGALWRPEGPNLFTYLPAALKYYPRWRATGDAQAYEQMIAAGFAPGSEFLWDHHHAVYWDLTQRTYREEIDPAYDTALVEAGVPFCASGTPYCDADYNYFDRQLFARDAVAKISLTGRIGKPLITLHGDFDALLPQKTNSDAYAELIRKAGRSQSHRYYVVQGGNHVDQLYDVFTDRLRPIAPCHRSALAALERWVEGRGADRQPPASRVIPRSGADLANQCDL